jgi:hypothetical protein
VRTSIDLEAAAHSAGPDESNYKALAASLPEKALVMNLWIDGQGRLVQVATKLTVANDKKGKAPLPLTLTESLSNFGVTVAPVAVPPAGSVVTLPNLSSACSG